MNMCLMTTLKVVKVSVKNWKELEEEELNVLPVLQARNRGTMMLSG